ncbi:hypothetical protein CBL_07982 [Carabus blaptoides fortunei]
MQAGDFTYSRTLGLYCRRHLYKVSQTHPCTLSFNIEQAAGHQLVENALGYCTIRSGLANNHKVILKRSKGLQRLVKKESDVLEVCLVRKPKEKNKSVNTQTNKENMPEHAERKRERDIAKTEAAGNDEQL